MGNRDDDNRVDTICPVCKGPAIKNNDISTTVYCSNSRCNYVGKETNG